MTFRLSERGLVDAVGRRLGRALAAMPIKAVQQAGGGISAPTASNYRRGELPDVFAPFFATLKAVGVEAALKVLEPIIGPADPAYHLSRLDEIEQTLKDIRHGVRAAASPGSAPEGRAAQDRREDPGLAGGVARALVGGDAGEGARDRRTLALSRQLAPFARPLGISEALAHARAAGNISLGFRAANDRLWRPLYLSRLNRLVPRELIGRPYVEHPDAAYGAAAQRDLEEAEDRPGDVAATVEAHVSVPRPMAALYRVVRRHAGTAGGHLVAAAVCRLDGLGEAA